MQLCTTSTQPSASTSQSTLLRIGEHSIRFSISCNFDGSYAQRYDCRGLVFHGSQVVSWPGDIWPQVALLFLDSNILENGRVIYLCFQSSSISQSSMPTSQSQVQADASRGVYPSLRWRKELLVLQIVRYIVIFVNILLEMLILTVSLMRAIRLMCQRKMFDHTSNP